MPEDQRERGSSVFLSLFWLLSACTPPGLAESRNTLSPPIPVSGTPTEAYCSSSRAEGSLLTSSGMAKAHSAVPKAGFVLYTHSYHTSLTYDDDPRVQDEEV